MVRLVMMRVSGLSCRMSFASCPALSAVPLSVRLVRAITPRSVRFSIVRTVAVLITALLASIVLLGSGLSAQANGPEIPGVHPHDGSAHRLMPLVVVDPIIEEAVSPLETKKMRGAVGFVSTPRISGQVKHDSVLSARPQAWEPGVHLDYQWLVNGKPVLRGTHASYRVRLSDIGKRVSVRITGEKAGSRGVTVTSAATAKVKSGSLTLTPKPSIFGSPRVGKNLIAYAGQWDKGVRFTYQWYANGKAIRNATKQTYKLKSKDIGKKFRVAVTGRKHGFEPAKNESGSTKAVKKKSRY